MPIADLAHAGRAGRDRARRTRRARQPALHDGRRARRRAPREVGEDGESAELELRLKMVCDAALLGFPNAGKSSLLRRISNAHAEGRRLPVHDARAAARHGRARTTAASSRWPTSPGCSRAHPRASGSATRSSRTSSAPTRSCTSSRSSPRPATRSPTAAQRYAAIHGELAQHGGGLAERPQIVVLNKLDLRRRERGRGARRRRSPTPSCAGELPPDAVVRARRARDAATCSASRAPPARASPTCAARSSACSPSARRAEPDRRRRGRARRLPALPPARRGSASSASCATTASCASPAARSCRSSTGSTSRRPSGVRELSIELGRLGVIDGAAPRGRQARRRGRHRRRALRVLAAARGGHRHDAATTRRTSSNGEHRDAARRRARARSAIPSHLGHLLLCQEAHVAARPLARRARADGRAAAPPGARASRPRCACAWRRPPPSATRR